MTSIFQSIARWFLGLEKRCKNGFVKSKSGKRFIKDRAFTKVIVTKTKARVTNVKKNKRTIQFIRRAAVVSKRIVKVNPGLRKLVLSKSLSALLKRKDIRARVKKFVQKLKSSKSKKVVDALKDKKKRRAMIRRYITKKYRRSLAKECNALLKTQYVKNLRKTQFKDSVKVIKKHGRISKELFRLPRNIIRDASMKNIKKFAALKFDVAKRDKNK